MTAFEQTAEQGLRAAIDAFGVSFTIEDDNRVYEGVMSDANSLVPLAESGGGFMDDSALEIHALKSDFAAGPAIGKKLTVGDKTYRITAITTSEGDPGVRIHLEGTEK